MESSIKEKTSKISYKNSLLIKHYLFGVAGEFGVANGTKSYAKAYGLDIENKKKVNIAAVEASKLLRNPKIKEEMRQVLTENGLDDETVDARLLDIIRNGSNMESIRAIHEYNKMKQRLTEKIEIKSPDPLTKLLREISDSNNEKNNKIMV